MAYSDANGPVHRRIIVPWYDTESVCLVVLVLMMGVFWFGVLGIQAGRCAASDAIDLWVPIGLVALSCWVIVSTTIRLVRRYLDRIG